MGCPEDFFKIGSAEYNKKKATVVFTMREQDFFSLLRGQLGALKAIRSQKLFLQGNVLNLLAFADKFVEPHVLSYLFDENGNPTDTPPKVDS